MKAFLNSLFRVSAAVAAVATSGAVQAGTASPTEDQVVVNAHLIAPDAVAGWRKRYGNVFPGRYWYDRDTGAWGREGGPTIGWVSDEK